MSRGLGKWQLTVMRMLTNQEWFFVRDVLGENFTRSSYSALMRGVNNLAKRGRVQLWNKARDDSRPQPLLVVARKGIEVAKGIPKVEREEVNV